MSHCIDDDRAKRRNRAMDRHISEADDLDVLLREALRKHARPYADESTGSAQWQLLRERIERDRSAMQRQAALPDIRLDRWQYNSVASRWCPTELYVLPLLRMAK